MSWNRSIVIAVAILWILGCAGQSGTASTWARLEPRVSAIHPRIVWRDSTGRELAPSGLKNAAGKLRWFIEDQDTVPEEAIRLFDRGREAGTAGRNDEAIRLFWQAHVLSPGWLYPVYEAAWSFFLEGNSSEAERLYAWIDRMEPRGYWTTKEALDCIRRERKGEWLSGTYESYARLEFEAQDARAVKLEDLVKRAPTLAPAWKDLTVLRPTPESRLGAVNAGLASRPDPETRGFLLVHEVTVLQELGRAAAADSLLDAMNLDSCLTMQVRALTDALLAQRR